MKKYDTLVIGHICKDKNTDHLGNTVYAAGGAVLYSSAAGSALGHHVGVLTKMNKSSSNSTNRSGSFRMSIRTKILMLGLSVAIIPLSLSAVVSSVKSRQTGRDNAIATVQNLTSSISSEVSEYINKSYAVVQSLSVSGAAMEE